MIILVVAAGAIIATGLYQQKMAEVTMEYERQQAQKNRTNPPANIDNIERSTDPFGLFGPEEMVYEVTLTTGWSAASHEDYHISTAHFSAPVIWVGPNNPVFTLGSVASAGIEEVAEEGRTRKIKQELEGLETAGDILSFQIHNSRVVTPGEISFEVTVNRDNPVVSLVSMIAPSPDWFVALEGLNMLSEGRWKETAETQLLTLDAGTEYGETFDIGNLSTQPQGIITTLTDIPSQELPPFATISFRQLGYGEEEQAQ